VLAVLRRRCVDPIVALLTQGTTPEKIALSIAILYLVLRPILHGAAAKLRNAQRPTQASISSASDL